MIEALDGFGVTGAYFAMAMTGFLFFSALLVFAVLLKGRALSFDESAKHTMLEKED